jgi:hypothetical protein
MGAKLPYVIIIQNIIRRGFFFIFTWLIQNRGRKIMFLWFFFWILELFRQCCIFVLYLIVATLLVSTQHCYLLYFLWCVEHSSCINLMGAKLPYVIIIQNIIRRGFFFIFTWLIQNRGRKIIIIHAMIYYI